MHKRKKSPPGAASSPQRREKARAKAAPRAKPLRSDVEALRVTPQPEVRALLHELRVHQLELELQNEELRTARGEQELALSRYTELFDFAPIGYATLRADHTLQDINHAGCQLLGR